MQEWSTSVAYECPLHSASFLGAQYGAASHFGMENACKYKEGSIKVVRIRILHSSRGTLSCSET